MNEEKMSGGLLNWNCIKSRKNILLCYMSTNIFCYTGAIWIHLLLCGFKSRWKDEGKVKGPEFSWAAPSLIITFNFQTLKIKLFCCCTEDCRVAWDEKQRVEKIRNYDHDFELAFYFILFLLRTHFIHSLHLLAIFLLLVDVGSTINIVWSRWWWKNWICRRCWYCWE